MTAERLHFPDESDAVFSECQQYRYRLWRRWDADRPMMMWVMLNPSTADQVVNDPTVERCQRRAVEYGYGGVLVCNIFALRSTDPKGLRRVQDPVGPENDRHILECAANAGMVVCGWGAHGAYQGRGKLVLRMLRAAGVTPFALRVTGGGHPGHPLYVPYSLRPVPIEGV